MATTHITTGETKSDRTKVMIARVFSYAFLVFVTIISLFPIFMLIINATRSHTQIAGGFSLLPSSYFIQNFNGAFTQRFSHGLLNSFIIAACSSVLSAYFSAMTAYGIHVYDFKLKKFAFTFIMIVMMIPTQISAVGFVNLVYQFKLNGTFWPLIIPSIAAPAVFFYLKHYIESSMPLEVIEAARVDGSNEFMTFNFIAIPMLMPAISVQLIFAFTSSWNNFFIPAMIMDKENSKTVPMLLSLLRAEIQAGSAGGNWGIVYMTTFLAIIPVVIVYIFISKNIVGGVALGAVKG